MVRSSDCLKKYGDPEKQKGMVLWDVPADLEIGVIPKRVYCNRDMVKPLEAAFKNIIERGLVDQLKTWDGCFNIRYQKIIQMVPGLGFVSIFAYSFVLFLIVTALHLDEQNVKTCPSCSA